MPWPASQRGGSLVGFATVLLLVSCCKSCQDGGRTPLATSKSPRVNGDETTWALHWFLVHSAMICRLVTTDLAHATVLSSKSNTQY